MLRLALVALLATPAVAEPNVVADTPAVHSLVAQVMGQVGTPDLLLSQGADPHNFQLRPSQARALANADLVFWVGPELTPWLDRALDSAPPEGEAVALLWTEGTTRLDFGEDHDGDEHEGEDHDGHSHKGTDPHAWLDPANAVAWITVIETRLSSTDPENAGTYAANAATARSELEALQSEVRATLAPAQGKPLYVFHNAYGYFTHAFGLTIAGTISEGDAATPGARRLAEIRGAIATSGTTCLFAEANHDPAYVESIAKATGARTGTLDPSGSTLQPGPDLYVKLMRALAIEIANCADHL